MDQTNEFDFDFFFHDYPEYLSDDPDFHTGTAPLPSYPHVVGASLSQGHPPIYAWSSNPPMPNTYHQWNSNTPTATNPSSASTPLPAAEIFNDQNAPPLSPVESKRKSDEEVLMPATKRWKSADEIPPSQASSQEPQAADIRHTGACLPCQMRTNRHKCWPGPVKGGACGPCLKRAASSSLTVDCRRARFQDVEIFRLGPTKDFANSLRWLRKGADLDPDKQKLWKPITNIPAKKNQSNGQQHRVLQLSQGFTKDTLNLHVQEFDPQQDDRLSYTWFENGSPREYRCPAFAISDADYAKQAISRFIDSSVKSYVEHLFPPTDELGPAFLRTVFQHALERAKESGLITLALRFWVACRFIEYPWNIVGKETLGMIRDPRPESPYARRIPVTPIMDFQIDNIVIYEQLRNLLKKIRTIMRNKIMPMKKEDWFDVHLATFILLEHADRTMAHDREFARDHNLPAKYSNRPLIEMVTFGANSLLEYHHHEKSHYPLSAASWHEVEKSYPFSEDQKAYLIKARDMIRQLSVPKEPESPLFWASQIYDSNWRPAIVEVV